MDGPVGGGALAAGGAAEGSGVVSDFPHDIGSGYLIERKLGTGSYATVWLARQPGAVAEYSVMCVCV